MLIVDDHDAPGVECDKLIATDNQGESTFPDFNGIIPRFDDDARENGPPVRQNQSKLDESTDSTQNRREQLALRGEM